MPRGRYVVDDYSGESEEEMFLQDDYSTEYSSEDDMEMQRARVQRHFRRRRLRGTRQLDYDPDFKGPVDSGRRPRDIPFVVLFILMWVGLIILAIYAYEFGDISRLYYPVDHTGNRCGVDNTKTTDEGWNSDNTKYDLRSRPYLFYPYPSSSGGDQRFSLCVSECPTTDACSPSACGSPFDTNFDACTSASSSIVCNYTEGSPPTTAENRVLAVNWAQSSSNVTAGDRCFCGYESSEVFRTCVPISSAARKVVQGYMDSRADWLVYATADLMRGWWVIVICTVVAIILSFIYLCALRICAPMMVWGTIGLVMLVLGTSAVTFLLHGMLLVFSEWIWTYWEQYNFLNLPFLLPFEPPLTDGQLVLAWVVLIIGLLLCALFILCLSLLLLMFKRILLAIGILKEASIAISSMPLLLPLPFLPVICIVAVLFFGIVVFLYLFSIGTLVYKSSCSCYEYEFDTIIRLSFIYLAFGIFWSVALLTAILETTIAGAVAKWYFTLDKVRLSSVGPIVKSATRVFVFNMGSLALGSLIVAIVQTIRVVVNFIEGELRKRAVRFKWIGTLLKLFSCFLWVYEKCIKFINRQAYIEIAIYGESFFPSAKRAFQLLVRNSLRVAAVNVIGDVLLFIGKMIVALITSTLACYLCIYGSSYVAAYMPSLSFLLAYGVPEGLVNMLQISQLRMWVFVIIAVFLISYAIATVFFAVFEMSVDTILLSFCEDVERNDGSVDRPYFMSGSLQRYISSTERLTHKHAKQG
jgi:hypothetical protein